MKKGIHPEYHKVVFMDTTSGYKFICGSTKTSKETIEMEDGNTYPLIKVEISSDSHPFYTGRQRFVEKGGRIEILVSRKQKAGLPAFFMPKINNLL